MVKELLKVVNIWQCLLLILVWHAPLAVHSTKHRLQSPEWTILSHVNCCFIQRKVTGFQVLLDSGLPQFSNVMDKINFKLFFDLLCISVSDEMSKKSK